MEIRLPFGRSHLTATVPDHIGVDIIEPKHVPAAKDPAQEVFNAINNLIGGIRWKDFSRSKSVAIAVNDKTRPVPHNHLLPPILDRLKSLGIPDEAITFYIAVGTHPPMEKNEFDLILPKDVLNRYKVISHNSEAKENLTYLGETTRGTPIWINGDYYKSDLKIVIGNIEPHQFVGFSGGVKSAAIGLAGLETVVRNHTLMIDPNAQLGKYENNPTREDIEEIGEKVQVHLAINAILNHDKEIVKVLAGVPEAVIAAGIPLSREVSQVAVKRNYRLTIASPGGHPKDINVYQAQKGLEHATLITQPGGTIIFAAACTEGAGSPHYENWIRGKSSHAEVVEEFKRNEFRIGPHKAFQIARAATKCRLLSFTDLDQSLAKTLLLNPIKDFDEAIMQAISEIDRGDRIAVLPYAASTIPYLEPGA